LEKNGEQKKVEIATAVDKKEDNVRQGGGFGSGEKDRKEANNEKK